MKNNSLKIVFISNVKKRIDTIFNNYCSSIKEASEHLSSITEDHQDDSNESFTTEEREDTSEDKLDQDVERLIISISNWMLWLQTVFNAVEVFVKNLFASLNSIIAYEGIFIQQSEELVKYQLDFMNTFNIEGLTKKK